MWQDFAVYSIVAGALFYLVRHWIASSRGEKGCGSCGGCQSAPKKEELVQIDLGGGWKQ